MGSLLRYVKILFVYVTSLSKPRDALKGGTRGNPTPFADMTWSAVLAGSRLTNRADVFNITAELKRTLAHDDTFVRAVQTRTRSLLDTFCYRTHRSLQSSL